MSEKSNLLLDNINYCLLPKLSINQEDSDIHVEYNLRENNLSSYFHVIINLLGEVDLKVSSNLTDSILSSLLILLFELESDGPWSTERCKECARELNHAFEIHYEFELDKLLLRNDVFNTQVIFDSCIDNIHKQLTYADFKKFPGLVEVYCKVIYDIKDYGLDINPETVFPVSLYLIDDYFIPNKSKGLKCSTSILQCLNSENFAWYGNYYELIFGCLMKSMLERDPEVTKLTFECLWHLFLVLPETQMALKKDKLYTNLFEQMQTESNIYRKAMCFNFVMKLIEEHNIHCIQWHVFKNIVCDSLDMCSNEAVAEILLQDVLKCLEMWQKSCWIIWKYPTDQRMISLLLKLLYITSKDVDTRTLIQKLLLTLITLCKREEKIQIFQQLENSDLDFRSNPEFVESIEMIKRNIKI